MHYANVLQGFAVDWEDCKDLKEEDTLTASAIIDKDYDREVIKWAPIFKDCLLCTFDHVGPLIYVLREDETVLYEAYDPLQVNTTTGVINSYFRKSGSLQDELVVRLPHTGPIYK